MEAEELDHTEPWLERCSTHEPKVTRVKAVNMSRVTYRLTTR
jgi:hypothetical protein